MDEKNKPMEEKKIEEPKKRPKKEMGKPVMVVMMAVLIALGFISGYYIAGSSDDGDGAAADTAEEVDTLEVDGLDELEEADELPIVADEPEAAVPLEEADSLDLPVIVFSPAGTFTDAEKTALTEKMAEPLFDWNADNDTNFVSIMISDRIYADIDDTYEYGVDAIGAGGIHSAFLFVEKGDAIDWWTPECLGDCVFTVEFTENYPEIAT